MRGFAHRRIRKPSWFNNDTNDVRYDKEAADLAWSRTIAFFKKHLAG